MQLRQTMRREERTDRLQELHILLVDVHNRETKPSQLREGTLREQRQNLRGLVCLLPPIPVTTMLAIVFEGQLETLESCTPRCDQWRSSLTAFEEDADRASPSSGACPTTNSASGSFARCATPC